MIGRMVVQKCFEVDIPEYRYKGYFYIGNGISVSTTNGNIFSGTILDMDKKSLKIEDEDGKIKYIRFCHMDSVEDW